MKTLKIDDKWSVEYDETQNDRPVQLLRHGKASGFVQDWCNPQIAMFYALLSHEEAAADTRRLTRELDVAMHGEAGAAKQASLCDLIPAAKALRANTVDAMMEKAHPMITVDASVQKTLRDEFAIAALQGLIAKSPFFDKQGEHGQQIDIDQFKADIAASAYGYADAMLKAREGV